MYILIIILLLFSQFFIYLTKNDKLKKILFIACVILLSCVLGFRGIHVGIDTIEYKHIFDAIANLSINKIFNNPFFVYDRVEIGYKFLNKIFSLVINNYDAFQVFVAFITICNFGFSFFKDNKMPFYCLIVFTGLLYLNAFNVSRQILSCSFIVLSFHYFLDKKWIITILLYLLAISFHTASFIFVVVYIFWYIKSYKYFPMIALSSVIIFYTSYLALMKIFLPYVENYEYLMDNRLGAHVGAGTFLIMYGAIISIAVYVFLFNKKYSRKLLVYSTFTLIYIITQILGLEFNYIDRLGYPFMFLVAYFLANFGLTIKNKNIKGLYFSLSSIAFILLFYRKTLITHYIYESFF